MANTAQQTEKMLSPTRAADYLTRLEAKLGRPIGKATILPSGGIEVMMSGTVEPSNPVDLVDMSE